MYISIGSRMNKVIVYVYNRINTSVNKDESQEHNTE